MILDQSLVCPLENQFDLFVRALTIFAENEVRVVSVSSLVCGFANPLQQHGKVAVLRQLVGVIDVKQ
jgi:hypothetical protein